MTDMTDSSLHNVIALIMGAGQSTRMHSKTSKLLHDLCGKPVIRHLTDLCAELGVGRIILIVGHDRDVIMNILGGACEYVVQEQQLGTGHAVLQALPLIKDHQGDILIFPGDSPFLTPEAVHLMVQRRRDTRAACSFLTTEFPVTPPYGRVIRNAGGRVKRIVEDKDCTPEQRAVTEVFTSHYCIHAPTVLPFLEKIGNRNAKGEYYLTDILGLLTAAGHGLEAVPVSDYGMTIGINDRIDLAAGIKRLQRRFFKSLMANGVTIIDPSATYVDVTVTIAADTTILPGSVLRGATHIGPDCVIGPSAHLRDTEVGAGSSVQHCILESCTVPDGVEVEPFQMARGSEPKIQPKH